MHLNDAFHPVDAIEHGEAASMKARPHQTAAIEDAVHCLRSVDRAQVLMACGTGKTLVGIRVLERFVNPGQSALVMVPSLALVDQWVRSWRAAGAEGTRILAVCSDADVGSTDDDAGVKRADLSVPSTTSAAQLAALLGEYRDAGQSVVVIATYASSEVLEAATADHGVEGWSFAICDEAHRVAGLSHEEGSRRWSTVLHDHLIPARKRLFLTATPRIHAAAKVNEAAETAEAKTVASMDDQELFGPVAHLLSFRNAVQRGLLSDFRIVIMVVDDREIGETLAGVPTSSARRLATQVVVSKVVARYQLDSVLVFHNRTSRSRLFADSLPQIASMMAKNMGERTRPLRSCHHVDGSTPRRQREAAFRTLRAAHSAPGWSVLSNCKCVAEGVDLPALDAVVIADVRRSAIDVTQVVGRAMRKAPHRDGPSYVVLPVYLAPGQDEETAVLASDFRHAFQVLTALCDHDELLAEELRAARQSVALSPDAVPSISRIEVVMPDRYTGRAVTAVSEHVLRRTTASFWGWFALLQRFAEERGHSQVEKDYRTAHGDALGTWVRAQRTAGNAGRLSADRRAALEGLPGWVWSVQEDAWVRQYADLEAYAAQHGNARPPVSHPLASWVRAQRQGIKIGWLTPERAYLLEELPGWAWNGTEAAWEEGYDELAVYAREHGTAAVPHGHLTPSGYKLGNWVVNQRRRLRDGRMRPSEPGRLEALPGWTWDPIADLWNSIFERVKDAWGEDGRTIEHDSDLGYWLAKQRVHFRRGKLDEGRQRVLSLLPRWSWEPKDSAWEQAFEAMAEFLRSHGHTSVGATARTQSGVQLRQWISRQRRDYRNGTLPQEQIARLEALPGWTWEPGEGVWQARYEMLLQYVDEHGTSRVPSEFRTDDGYGLGEWVRSQRRRISAGHATENQKVHLESLPGFVRGPRDR